MAAKQQSPIVWQKEAEAMAAKRQLPVVWQKEAEAISAKSQSPIVQECEFAGVEQRTGTYGGMDYWSGVLDWTTGVLRP